MSVNRKVTIPKGSHITEPVMRKGEREGEEGRKEKERMKGGKIRKKGERKGRKEGWKSGKPWKKFVYKQRALRRFAVPCVSFAYSTD